MNTSRPGIVIAAVVLGLASLTGPGPAAGQESSRAEAKKLYGQAINILSESVDEKPLYQALALFEKASELDPKNEDVWIQIAWRCWMLGDDLPKEAKEDKKKRLELFEKGMSAGEKALAINSRSVGGLYWYTVNMASAGEMKGILSSLSMAGTLFGNMSRVDRRDPYYLYGATRRFGSEVFVRVPAWLTEQFGFTPEYIEEDLLMNIEKWPNYFTNYTYLARIYIWRDNREKALKMLEYVLARDPSVMPEEKAENEKQKNIARVMWKDYTGKNYPER